MYVSIITKEGIHMKYIWENPEIIKENKEDGHSLALCYDTADSAAKREASPYKLSLNGTWKFFWYKGVGSLPEKFRAYKEKCFF